MEKLGTILPNRRTFELEEQYATRLAEMKAATAARVWPGVPGRDVCGEIRYSLPNNHYGIIGADNRPRCFKATPCGDFHVIEMTREAEKRAAQ